ncbi:MAG: gliding motility-associated C-terminal domain-containing protein [Bacteroidales bacterium]|nr:gliding motility-associated C-terminal domain-containing protein [Bacteroidales bacterium]MDZ4203940.1 gliding motility-associated C-terminal domain-containing protein [Bacteroidales bacterium]
MPNKQVCPGLSVSIPITYQNLTSVDSFQLVFTYNAAALTYSGYSYLHPYLLGARFNIQHQQGRIIMILRSGGALSFEDGSLIEFTFMTGLNTSNLEWDLSQSAYFLNANPLPASFTGGSIDIFPRIIISLQQLPAEVCPGSFAASIIASVRGGAPPYIYQWIGSPIQVLSDSIARNLATGFRYTLRITDNNSCVKDTSFYVKTRKLNQVEIQAKPDTVFISNPEVTFTAENKSTPFITKYLWRFGDGDSISTTSNSIIHLYDGVKQYVKDFGPEKPYSVSLTITNEYGCDTTITHTLVIKEAKIFVPNIFTPNGDGANDVFRIVLDDNKDKDVTYEFIKLELAVFNRWGRKVYSNDNYKNDWDGGNLADGVYFYALNTHGLFKTDTYKGAIHILR